MTSHHAICKFRFIESDWFSICFDFFASITPLSRNNFRSAYDVFLLLEASYTDNHVSYWSILLPPLCHTTVVDHLFPDQSGKSFGTGLWRTRRKLWTSCSTDQTGGDQKRREEKIKEKKERKSHCSIQNKPSYRAWWTLGLRLMVGFHSTWAFLWLKSAIRIYHPFFRDKLVFLCL